MLWLYLRKFKPNHSKPDQWRDWRWFVHRLGRMPVYEVFQVAWWLGALAADLERSASRQKFVEWQSWAVDQAETSGAALIHKYLKGPVPWTKFELHSGNGGPQENADNRARKWHQIWRVGGTPAPIQWPREVEVPIAGVLQDVPLVREVALGYKTKTALGTDWVHPRHYGMLSDDTLWAMLVLCRVMLMLGFIPAALAYLLIALIPKASGGERPIGIFPSFLRIMSKVIRMTYCKKWLAKNDRSYLFGRKGRSALTCVWQKALLAEHATYRGVCAASAMLDIVKAFDGVDHPYL
eukprot:9087535-Karenia_brevis.AAC.1